MDGIATPFEVEVGVGRAGIGLHADFKVQTALSLTDSRAWQRQIRAHCGQIQGQLYEHAKAGGPELKFPDGL